MSNNLDTSALRIIELEQRISELAKSKSKHEVMNRLLTSLSSVSGLDNMLQHIPNILMQTIGADNIAIIFFLNDSWQYRDIYGTSRQYQKSENPNVDAVLASEKPLRVNHGTLINNSPADGDSIPIENWIFPLISHNRKIGVVCMEGMQLTDGNIFSELLPFFVYAGLMLDNEISNYSRLAEAHRKLQDSETLYRSLFEQSPDGIMLWNVPQLEVIQFNRAAHTQLGYTPEEFAKLKVQDLRIRDDTSKINNYLRTLHLEGSVSFEAEHLTKTGALRTNLVSLKMLEIAGQQMVLAIHRDITEDKLAEENMALMNFALDNIHEAVFLVEQNARIKYVNAESCRALGYTREEFFTLGVPDLDPEFPAAVQPNLWPEHWQNLRQQGSLNFESTHCHKDGTCFPVEVTDNYFEYNGTGYSLALARDITERKRAEEERLTLEKQMLHAQKLESLGVLAGGIAHDFNNILTAIIGNAELALRRINKESPAVENLGRIEQAASRAADLAKQMLAYSGKGKFVVENIDLNLLLEEMLYMLEVSISKKAVLRLNPYESLPQVEADATQLRQIVMNLVINASEAIGNKSGVIAVTTGVMDCNRSYLKDVWLDENLTSGLYVYLEIADTGCGMDGSTLAKLFDPFFSTKFTGRGLGMSAVLGIVRGHKGAIKVYSEPDKGTSFKILFPASDRPAALFNADLSENDWQGTGKVLLVDDEETLRGIGSEMLQELGFTTLTAEDGKDALEVFQANPDISLVILDLTMPHMDGEQCFRELRRLSPNIKVIMSSGYNEHEVTQKFAGKGLAGFVQKPYTLSVLTETIRLIK